MRVGTSINRQAWEGEAVLRGCAHGRRNRALAKKGILGCAATVLVAVDNQAASKANVQVTVSNNTV